MHRRTREYRSAGTVGKAHVYDGKSADLDLKPLTTVRFEV